MLLLSWVAAVVCCLGYGVGSVLQSVGAKRTVQQAGVSGIGQIVRQLPYLLGLASDGLAFVGNVVALQRLPLFLVQALVTASVGVTALISALRGDRLGRRGWLSLAALGAGLVILGVTAHSETAVRIPHLARWVITGSILIPIATGLIGLRLRGRASYLTLAATCGLAWTAVAVSSRAISADRLSPHLLADPLLWTVVAQGVIGMAFFAFALQRGPVTVVTAVTFMLELAIPAAVGLLLLGDTVVRGTAPLAALGFGLAVVGTLALIRYAEEPGRVSLPPPS